MRKGQLHAQALQVRRPSRYSKAALEVDLRTIPDILDLVIPHVSRWQLFKLNTDNHSDMVCVCKALSGLPEAPALKKMSLVSTNMLDAADEMDLLVPFSGNAPQLEVLELRGVSLDWTRCKFLRPGSVLTRLNMRYIQPELLPTFDNFFRWLKGAPRLVTLQLSSTGPGGDPAQWPNWSLKLGSVKRLHLESLKYSQLVGLLSRAKFPNLCALKLEVFTSDGDLTAEALCDHLLLGKLRELDVFAMPNTKKTCERFWGSLHQLEILRIRDQMVNSHFEDVWKRPETMPCLHTLTISGELEGDKLQALVRARQTAMRPLTTLRVYKSPIVTETQAKWLERNVGFVYINGRVPVGKRERVREHPRYLSSRVERYAANVF